MTPNTDPSLLNRLQNPADAEAWTLFVATYGPLIVRHCRRRGLQEADAVDVSQNTLAKVLVSIARFEYEPARGGFRAWLGAVVRSCVNDFLTARRRLPHTGASAGLNEESAGAIDAEWTSQFHDHILRVAMDRCRGDFTATNWRAFELVWIEALSAPDAAAQLHIPVADVYVAKFRILQRLRREVATLAEDLPFLFVGK